MRTWLITLIFAINAFAAQYGVLAVCTRVGGVDYCYVNESRYTALEIEGRLVIANGFNIVRFYLDGPAFTKENRNGAKVKHVKIKDEAGEPYMMMESRDNLWIADTSGCVTMRYVKGNADSYARTYSFAAMDSIEMEMEKVAECRESGPARDLYDN